MTTSNSKSLLITLTSVSLILLVILIFGIYKIKSMNEESSKLLNQANQSTEARIRAQSIKMLQNMAAQDLAAFDSLVLSPDKTVPLIEKIEGAGRKLGLDTEIVSVDEIDNKNSSEPKVIKIVVETQGAWSPTVSFLKGVESLPYRVMIDESNIIKTNDTSQGDGLNWKLRIVLRLHLFN